MSDSERPLALRKHHYSDEEAKEILAKAMEQPTTDGFSPTELATLAQELGIAPGQLEAAEQAWIEERADQEGIALRHTFIAERRREARDGIVAGVTVAAIAWLATTFSIPVLSTIAAVLMVPLTIMGIMIFLQAWEAIFETSGHDFDKSFTKWLERRHKHRKLLAPPSAGDKRSD